MFLYNHLWRLLRKKNRSKVKNRLVSEQDKAKGASHVSDVLTINQLPNELIKKVIDYLSMEDRITVRRLNRTWRQMSFKNIRELVVGNFFEQHEVFRRPLLCLNSENDLKSLKCFELVLEESGNSLQTLFLMERLQSSKVNTGQDWKKLISRISTCCPRLTGLYITDYSGFFSDIHLPLIKRFGPQLQMYGIESIAKKMNNPSLISLCINPQRLQALKCCVSSQLQLDEIASNFPLLTTLWIKSTQDNDDFDLVCLEKLVHLKSLSLSCPDISHPRFRALLNSTVVQRLHEMHLDCNCRKFSQSCLSLFENLASLRCLKIDILKDFQLFLVLNPLKKRLEKLYLNLIIKSDDEITEKGLRTLSRLEKLTKLDLKIHVWRHIKCIFAYFDPMLSVTHLALCLKTLSKNPEDSLHESLRKDFLKLPVVFPNLIVFRLKLETNVLTDLEFFQNNLAFCIARMPRLRTLEVCHFLAKDMETRLFCKRREIKLRAFSSTCDNKH